MSNHMLTRGRSLGTLARRGIVDRFAVLHARFRPLRPRAVARFAFVVAAIMLSAFALLDHFVPTASTTLPPPYRPSMKYGFVAAMPSFSRFSLLHLPSDSTADNYRSTVVLFENDKPVGPAHSFHSTVHEVGGGRYSHWGDQLQFSTTDNGDPNSNGNVYSIRYRLEVRRSVFVALALTIIASSIWLVCLIFPKTVISITGAIGFAALSGNVYGLLIDLNLPTKFKFVLRPNDTVWSYSDTIDHIDKARKDFRRGVIDDDEFVREMMRSVNYRMTNIHRKHLGSDEALRVPISKNWVLWLYGARPEYKNYDFADAYRSLERGLGMCGAQSETVARLLGEDGFKSGIFVSNNVHTVAWATSDTGSWVIDPDYGVVLEGSLEDIYRNLMASVDSYSNMLQTGYNDSIRQVLLLHYSSIASGAGVYSIKALEDMERKSALYQSRRKLAFEDWAYAVKWLIPTALVLPSVIVLFVMARRRLAS